LPKLHYYTSPDHLIESQTNKRLKISRYNDVNDPFELAPFDISNKELRAVHHEQMGKLNARLGLICLSKTWQSPPMWAHYAKNYTGACLELEVTYDHLFEIKYRETKSFPGLTLEDFVTHINAKNIKEVFGTKAKEWAYEQERRLHVPLDHERVIHECKDGKDFHFLPFHVIPQKTFRLLRVYVGNNCRLGINRIKQATKSYRYSVDVVQTRPAFSKFKVVRQKDKSLWHLLPRPGKD